MKTPNQLASETIAIVNNRFVPIGTKSEDTALKAITKAIEERDREIKNVSRFIYSNILENNIKEVVIIRDWVDAIISSGRGNEDFADIFDKLDNLAESLIETT